MVVIQLAVNTGLTFAVVYSLKDTDVGENGVTTIKGSDQPTSVGTAMTTLNLEDVLSLSPDDVADVNDLQFVTDDGTILTYTITGAKVVRQDGQGMAIFYSARGDTVTVSEDGIAVEGQDGSLLYMEEFEDGKSGDTPSSSAANSRNLLAKKKKKGLVGRRKNAGSVGKKAKDAWSDMVRIVLYLG